MPVFPLKIMIRTEGEWVVAYVATADETTVKDEVSRFRNALLDQVPGLFDKWVKVVEEMFRWFIESEMNLKPQAILWQKPDSKN